MFRCFHFITLSCYIIFCSNNLYKSQNICLIVSDKIIIITTYYYESIQTQNVNMIFYYFPWQNTENILEMDSGLLRYVAVHFLRFPSFFFQGNFVFFPFFFFNSLVHSASRLAVDSCQSHSSVCLLCDQFTQISDCNPILVFFFFYEDLNFEGWNKREKCEHVHVCLRKVFYSLKTSIILLFTYGGLFYNVIPAINVGHLHIHSLHSKLHNLHKIISNSSSSSSYSFIWPHASKQNVVQMSRFEGR